PAGRREGRRCRMHAGMRTFRTRLSNVSLVLVLVLVAIVVVDPFKDSPMLAEMREAWGAAQSHVREGLRAPTTAVFPEFNVDHIRGHGHRLHRWRIESYVDSQNGFGALLRMHYVAEVATPHPGRAYVTDVRVLDRFGSESP